MENFSVTIGRLDPLCVPWQNVHNIIIYLFITESENLWDFYVHINIILFKCVTPNAFHKTYKLSIQYGESQEGWKCNVTKRLSIQLCRVSRIICNYVKFLENVTHVLCPLFISQEVFCVLKKTRIVKVTICFWIIY